MVVCTTPTQSTRVCISPHHHQQHGSSLLCAAPAFQCAARSRSVPPGPRRLFFGGVPAALPSHSFALGRCGEVWAPRSPGRNGRDARWCCPPPRPRPVFPSFVSAACAALARVFRHSFPRMCERAPPPAGPSPLFVLVVPGFEGRDGWLKCED